MCWEMAVQGDGGRNLTKCVSLDLGTKYCLPCWFCAFPIECAPRAVALLRSMGVLQLLRSKTERMSVAERVRQKVRGEAAYDPASGHRRK